MTRLSDALKSALRRPAAWIALATLILIAALFAMTHGRDDRDTVWKLRGSVMSADNAFKVLLKDETQRSAAFEMLGTAQSMASVIDSQNPCLSEAVGYVAGFLGVMRSAKGMDNTAIADMHRYFMSTAPAKIDKCEKNL